MRFSVDKLTEFCLNFFMENSSSPISFPPLLSFLSLPSKTQDLLSWALSVIEALSKEYENLKVMYLALKEEMGGATKLLEQKDNVIEQKDKIIEQKDKVIEQKDKIIDSLTRRSQELENRLNTNSTNSNRPPSTDPPFVDRSKPSSQKDSKPTSEAADTSENHTKPKKRPYHRGASQKPMTPTEKRDCYPQVCPHCGGKHFEAFTECAHFQYIELPVICLIVILFRIFEGRCSNCHKVVKGSVPQEFQTSYGSRLSAFIAYLLSEAGLPRRQVQKLLKDIFGLTISQGGLQNVEDRASEAIEPLYQAIAESVRRTPACHIDETSWPTHGQMGKHLHWLWFMGCCLLAFFMIDEHRSKEAFYRLIGEWRGILISDDYRIYQIWEGYRQSCLAHLKREILKLKQSANPEERKLGELAGSFFKTLCDMSPESTTMGEIWALKSRIVKLARRFGHLKGHAGAFVRRLEKNFESLWFFVTEPLVDKTNNFAERQIRTAVCHRKISFGSSAPKGERWIERSLSLRKTCALHGRSYFTVLVKAIDCYHYKTRPQTYWIRKSVWRLHNAWMYGNDCCFLPNQQAL